MHTDWLCVLELSSFVNFVECEEKNRLCYPTALQTDMYFMVGRIMAVSLVHGGPSPTFLSRTLFDAIIKGMDRVSPTIQDIHDRTLRQQLEDVREIVLSWMHADKIVLFAKAVVIFFRDSIIVPVNSVVHCVSIEKTTPHSHP